METFTRLTAIAAPLPNDNVDTDAIIPAVSLKRVGVDIAALGDYLFYEWRFDPAGKPIEDFVLNRPQFAAPGILVAGRNFGCGSSREHAVWSLLYAEVRCVVASSFGDIFYDNCFRNGVLPAIVRGDDHARLMRDVIEADGAKPMTVDLEAMRITAPSGEIYGFDVDPAGREALLRGLDDIAMTLEHEDEIAAFQQRHSAMRPWLYNTRFRVKASTSD